MSIAVFIQIDGLENMFVKLDLGWKLALVICAVEAHFEFGQIGRVHFDVVHGLEILLRPLVARGLVGVGEFGNGSRLVVEVLVVLAHVVGVPVRDGDVVGELGGAEYFAFAQGGGGG
jgi:hypothetical protein